MSEYYEGPTYGIRDRQQDKPTPPICTKCGTPISHRETYYMDGSAILCRACLEDRVKDFFETSFDRAVEAIGYDPITYDAREE